MSLEQRIASRLEIMDRTMIGMSQAALTREMARVAIKECHSEITALLPPLHASTFIKYGVTLAADALIPPTVAREDIHEPS